MKNMRKYWHDRQQVCVFAGGIKKKKRFNWEQLIKEQLLLIIVQHYSSE